jgi:hypothetical protein
LIWIRLRILSGEVRMRPEDLSAEAADAFRMWRNVFGLSESAALNAVQQDGLVETSEFDRTASSLANIFNLTEEQGRIAAQGRESVSEAQRSWSSAGTASRGGDASEARFRLAQEALSRMSDAECDQMLAEEQRRRKAAKKTTPVRSGGSRSAVVSERNGGR